MRLRYLNMGLEDKIVRKQVHERQAYIMVCAHGSHFGSSHFGSRASPGHPDGSHVRGSMADVVGLVATTHGECLRLLASALLARPQGLHSASRLLRAHLPAHVVRRLAHLDSAFAVVRHATQPYCDALIADVSQAVEVMRQTRREQGTKGGRSFGEHASYEQKGEERIIGRFLSALGGVASSEDRGRLAPAAPACAPACASAGGKR